MVTFSVTTILHSISLSVAQKKENHTDDIGWTISRVQQQNSIKQRVQQVLHEVFL